MDERICEIWNDALAYFKKAESDFKTHEMESAKVDAKNAVFSGLVALTLVYDDLDCNQNKKKEMLDKAYDVCSFSGCANTLDYLEKAYIILDYFINSSPAENKLWGGNLLHECHLN